MKELVCKRCLIKKSVRQFHRRHTARTGHDSLCRDCRQKALRGEFKDKLANLPHNPEVLFWPRVQKTRGCWLWKGSTRSNGYAQFSYGGRKNARTVLVHRFSYELHYGPIPENDLVCHRCDRRSCVKPTHLFLASHEVNMRDMVRKNRQAKGVNTPKHRSLRKRWRRKPEKDIKTPNPFRKRLGPAQVQAMRSLYASGNYTCKDIAEVFGVSHTSAWEAITYRTWKHI